MRAMCCYTIGCGVVAEQVKQVAFLSDWGRARHPRGGCTCVFLYTARLRVSGPACAAAMLVFRRLVPWARCLAAAWLPAASCASAGCA